MNDDQHKGRMKAAETLGGDLLFHDLFAGTPGAAALAQGEVAVFRSRRYPRSYEFMTPGIEQLTGYPATSFTPDLWDSILEKVVPRGEVAGLSIEEAQKKYYEGCVSRWSAECLIRQRNGEQRWILDLKVPLRDATGRVVGSFGFLHDITAQRSAGMSQGRRPDTATHPLAGQLPAIVWMTDAQLRCTLSEGMSLRNAGLKPGEFVGGHISDYFGSSSMEIPAITAHHKALAGEAADYDLELGGHRFAAHLEPMRGRDGVVTGVIGVAVDVTSYRETEVRLLQREAYERALLQAIPDLIAVIDAEGNYTDFKEESSREAVRAKTDVIGRNLGDLPFHHEDRALLDTAIRAAISSGSIQHVEYRYASETGPTWWDARIARLDAGRVILVARDITTRKRAEEEQRRIEEQMRSAQQLESLGVLAGGIAHDFNNLLVGILGNAEIALKDMPPGPAADCIAEVRTAATRAAELTNLMLAYAGRGKFQTTTLDLNVVACEVTQLVQAAISKKVALDFELDRTLPSIRGDIAQLRQVIMNLVINAAESFGDREGDVYLRTGIAQVASNHTQQILPAGAVHPGRYIFLEVRDTGCGMDASTLRRIFDPFFTTKFTGRGLGLSASLGILRSHNGGIHVESDVGAGSTFTIFLPPAVVSSSGDTSPDIPKQRAPLPADITGRILVVDDEEIVRRVVKRQLERAGFSVLCEADGRQAVQLIADQPELIDLVLLDLTMPGMGGEEVLLHLRSIGFKHPVVLMSGYDESEAATLTKKLGVFAFIRKPFTNDLLVNTLRAALAANRPRAPITDATIADDRR